MTISDDPRLPSLNTTDSRWLVQEAQSVLADLGHDATVIDGVALALTSGAHVGLDNLARTVALLPRREWSDAVRRQLTALLAVDPGAQVDPDDLRLRLVPVEQYDDFVEYEPMEPLPGLLAILAAQRQGATTLFGKLDQVGERDDAYDTALRNLAALPKPRHTRRRVDTRVTSSWVDFLDAPDAFGAARALVLPEMVRRVLRVDFPETGLLVSVPTRHTLWIHVPVDEDVLHTGLRMAQLSWQTWSEEPYALSPNVYLVSPDMHARCLLAPDGDGVTVHEMALHDLMAPFLDPDERAA